MHPTLKTSDILTVESYQGREIRPGDVAVFRSPESGEHIVHRIITVEQGRITTRGDNSDSLDSFVLGPDDIIGRVVAAGLGQHRRRIHGGLAGRIAGALNRIRRGASRQCSRILHGPYHRLARTGFPARLLPRNLRPRIIRFNRPEGTELHLFIGKRAIGVRRAADEAWKIDRPFRLFVDESQLPGTAAQSTRDTMKANGSR